MSLRTRLTLVSAAAVAIAVALASSAVYFAVRGVLRGGVDSALRERAAESRIVSGPNGFIVRLPSVRFGGPGGYAQLISASGSFPVPSRGEPVLPVSQAAREVAAGDRPAFFQDVTVDGVHLRVLTRQVLPGLAVAISRPLEEVDRTLNRLLVVLVLLTAGGIALGAVLGRLVAQTALGPVRRLSEATEHVTATQDLSARVEASGQDELSRLAASFNTMLEALDRSVGAQRQLVADASHELRTPLTSLRTNVEVLARSNELAPEESEQLLSDVIDQIEELTLLVSDVVELARGNEPPAEVGDIRLDELVDEAVERAQRHSPRVRFETEMEPTVVRGAPARISRAVGNLLDNAAKWSPPDGVVDVAVHDREVTVRDHGPGIDDADLPHVFDRFYRAPAARGLPGSGLGLAIVRQVAEAHGGRVSAARAEGGGAVLRLTLGPADRNGAGDVPARAEPTAGPAGARRA
jgi:two-component system, OmpR family, sensor histidine kinase MprB